MTKPNYEVLLQQIAQEQDPVIRNQLILQCYVFDEELTPAEKQLFNYCNDGYIDANPGLVGNSIKSYVGTYYSEEGTPL
jgi:hypothetical protein